MDFQQDVIERSQEVPVVVDFWAPWCGPCRVLGPVIESLAAEAKGTWELVKVNTEEHQALSQRYQIMSIPAVRMFHRGEIVAEFNGALPKGHIQKWLDTYLPNEEKQAFADLLEELDQEPGAQSLARLRAFVAQYPHHAEARFQLALERLFVAPEETKALLAEIPSQPETLESLEDFQTLLRLQAWEGTGKTPVETKLKAAQVALENQDFEAAIELLIEAVGIDKSFADDLPRKACVAFFRTFWGNQHPLTQKHRFLFNMALY